MASFTKFAIMKAFGDLAVSRPVDKITVKDITDRCGISRNTFYYHYQDIYQVLKAYVQYASEQVISMMAEEVNDEKAGLRGARYLEAHRELLCNLYRSAANEEVRTCLQSASQVIFDRFIDNMSRGMGTGEKDRQILSSVCQYMVQGIMTSWLDSDGMVNGESLEAVLIRIDYLLGDMMKEALLRSASREKKEGCDGEGGL